MLKTTSLRYFTFISIFLVILVTLVLIFLDNGEIIYVITFGGALVFMGLNLLVYEKNEIDLAKEIEQKMEAEAKWEREKQAKALEQQKHEQKISTLQFNANINQVDPHFAANLLDSFRGLLILQKQKIRDSNLDSKEKQNILEGSDNLLKHIGNFTSLFRNMVANRNDFQTDLLTEIDFVRNYLKLEELRSYGKDFQERLTTDIDISEELEDTMQQIIVPKSFLLTYVSNAVIHGIEHKKDRIGTVKVRLYQSETHLIAEITDDGVGMAQSAFFNKGHKTMKDKLRKGSNAGLSLVKEMYEFWNKNTHPHKSYHEFSDILDENKEVAGTKAKVFLALVKTKFEH
jgi:sensor histidine kinase YesM